MLTPARRRWLSAALIASTLAVPAWALRIRTRALPVWCQTRPDAAVGAFHVHSDDSHDSRLTREAIAAAAQGAGLHFVVITDHNRQRPDAALVGVTLLSSAELSTPTGHVIQFGVPFVPDRAGRHAPDLLAHIAADGGSAMLAHPCDPKRPWAGPLEPVRGIEIANVASAARRAGGPLLLGLLPPLLAWPLNRDLALAQLTEGDAPAVALWDAHHDAGWIGLCGSDAHGWIDLETNLRAWQIVLTDPWPAADATFDPAHADATALRARLTAGRFACVNGLLGAAPAFAFTARGGTATLASQGDRVAAADVTALDIEAPATSAGPSEIVLLRDGVPVAHGPSPVLTLAPPGPGSYRVEVRVQVPGLGLGSHAVTAIYSNPIVLTAPP